MSNIITTQYEAESGTTYIVDASYTYFDSPATREHDCESELEIVFTIYPSIPEGEDGLELNEALLEGSTFYEEIATECIADYWEGVL